MTPSLARAFGGPVHGVEPSDKMRAQAVANAAHPAVTYAAGSAEHIPLPGASCDAALLFFVWHHVVDRQAAAQELHRVVKPSGKLFVQANFSDKMPHTWWFRVVPEWRKADQAQFRSEEEVRSDFAHAGWTLVSRDEIAWLRSATLDEDFERLKLRPVSMFEHMTEEVVERGLVALRGRRAPGHLYLRLRRRPDVGLTRGARTGRRYARPIPRARDGSRGLGRARVTPGRGRSCLGSAAGGSSALLRSRPR
jgi:SAM-dependent methyltransferase